MSSNSYAPEDALGTLLGESLDTLAQEIPKAHERLCSVLDGRAVHIRVDGESAVAAFEAGHATIVPESDPVTATFATTRRAILAVLDGEIDLPTAVLKGMVEAKASLDDLVVLNRALNIYTHGAVRAPSFPALLQRFRPEEP